jgi:hypothetical protein
MEEPHAFFAVVLTGSFLFLPSGGGGGGGGAKSSEKRRSSITPFLCFIIFGLFKFVHKKAAGLCHV